MVPEDCLVFNERLHRKRALGEGGFAFVELAELDGCKPVAVKTLKPELLPSEGDVRLFLSETALMRKLRHDSIVEMIGIGGSPENAVITNSTKSSLAGISNSSDQTISEGVVDGPQPLSELYIVQEFCAGGSLRDLVFKQMGQGPKKLYSKLDALRWMIQIAKALKYMHSAKPKVIHRDLKLDNVLLTDSNPHAANVKLADFGLARALTASRPSSASSSSQLL
jgi:serine/threonine protein kinase